jgi:hypothetical protein
VPAAPSGARSPGPGAHTAGPGVGGGGALRPGPLAVCPGPRAAAKAPPLAEGLDASGAPSRGTAGGCNRARAHPRGADRPCQPLETPAAATGGDRPPAIPCRNPRCVAGPRRGRSRANGRGTAAGTPRLFLDKDSVKAWARRGPGGRDRRPPHGLADGPDPITPLLRGGPPGATAACRVHACARRGSPLRRTPSHVRSGPHECPGATGAAAAGPPRRTGQVRGAPAPNAAGANRSAEEAPHCWSEGPLS